MYYNEAKKNKTETQIKERKVRSNENLTFYPIQSKKKVQSNENMTFQLIQSKKGRYSPMKTWCFTSSKSKKGGTIQWRLNVLPHPNQIWKVPAQKIVMFAPSNLEKEVQSTEDIVFYPIQI